MSPKNEHPIILFDGVCNLCNGAVQWIIKRDRRDVFRFGSLQGEAGREIQQRFDLDSDALDSILLLRHGVLLAKSDAVLEIARGLGGIYRIGFVFRLIPREIRDKIYDWIARNRYRWFGRQEECMLPRPEWRDRFLV